MGTERFQSYMLNEKITDIVRANKAIRNATWPARIAVGRYLKWRAKSSSAAIERLASMLVEDPVLRVAEFDGVFALAPRSHIFRRLVTSGYYEPELTARCRALLDRNRDAVDIGANIGFHSVLFSKHLDRGRVLAVEPTRNALVRLKRNLAMNEAGGKVTIFEGVASDRPGQIEIKTISGLEEYSTIGAMGHPSVGNAEVTTQTVEARPLDELVFEHKLDVGFIKVDVEGAEHLVFKGAQKTLSTCRPVVLSELSDTLLRKNGSSAKAVVEMFEELDYVVTDPHRPGIKPGSVEFGDILCVPREHPSAKQG